MSRTTTVQCDRCKADVTRSHVHLEADIERPRTYGEDIFGDWPFDLCWGCAEKVRQFIVRGPEAMER